MHFPVCVGVFGCSHPVSCDEHEIPGGGAFGEVMCRKFQKLSFESTKSLMRNLKTQ